MPTPQPHALNQLTPSQRERERERERTEQRASAAGVLLGGPLRWVEEEERERERERERARERERQRERESESERAKARESEGAVLEAPSLPLTWPCCGAAFSVLFFGSLRDELNLTEDPKRNLSREGGARLRPS